MTATKTVKFPEDQFHTLCNLFQLMAVAGLKLYGTGNALPSDEKINDVWITLRDAALAKDPDKIISPELEFLRFYFKKVYKCLGPADDDIIDSIKTQYTKETGKPVPDGY